MPKAFTDYEKELIGSRLLDQGYRLFSAYGLKKTNIEEIAAAAGISKGAFYNFYESKEALFMEVIEQVEVRARREILAMIDQPGGSPRVRLLAAMKKAFSLLESVPLLKFFTGSDYDLLFRRLPAGQVQAHFANDQAFIEELIAHCQKAGIPIQAQPHQIAGLLYPLVLGILHKDMLELDNFDLSMELLLELVAAYCLGEIELHTQPPSNPTSGSEEGRSL